MEKLKNYSKSDVLSASEIGQYTYCSYAWLLQRYGYKAESPFLESGKRTHIALGNKIEGFEARMQDARWYAILGFLALCLAFLLFSFGVVL